MRLRPWPEMWLVTMFDAKGNPQGYELFHPNRAAAEAKMAEIRASLDTSWSQGVELRVVRYVVGEVLP